MKKEKQAIESRPYYFRGQLLLEGDFQAEQNYHVNARCRHNLRLHGWGVVYGLNVARESEDAVRVSPGYGIDELGREIVLGESVSVSLSDLGPQEVVKIGLEYEEEELDPATKCNRRKTYAVVTASRAREKASPLNLAIVTLDDKGKVKEDAIDCSTTRYAGAIVGAGSITAEKLHDELRTGWLTMPFRPIALDHALKGEEEIRPAFRVGSTAALSPDPETAGESDKGAGGTMAIPVPPSVKQVRRFRIAGTENKGEIIIELFAGGWNSENMKHHKETLLEESIKIEPYEETYPVDFAIDPEYHTLSLRLKGTRRTRVSLIAVEFSY